MIFCYVQRHFWILSKTYIHTHTHRPTHSLAKTLTEIMSLCWMWDLSICPFRANCVFVSYCGEIIYIHNQTFAWTFNSYVGNDCIFICCTLLTLRRKDNNRTQKMRITHIGRTHDNPCAVLVFWILDSKHNDQNEQVMRMESFYSMP